MKDLLVQLDDLPDEILIYIFEKLSNDEVLYSLIGVNQRLNRIVHDTIFTRELHLLEYGLNHNSTFPLPDPILDRICSKILPTIGHKIESLFLERTSIERVLHATNYPNLNNLGLCNIYLKEATSLLCPDNNPLAHIFKNQTSLLINLNHEKNMFPMGSHYPSMFTKILALFTNLRCLKFNPSSSYRDALYFYITTGTNISSTLLELHVTLREMEDCLNIFDGRFDQLRILYVNVYHSLPEEFGIEDEPNHLLTNLRIFSLCCKEEIYDLDKLNVLVLCRMLNLEELDLNIKVKCNEKFLDSDTLKKDIIVYMPRLYKFTFNICSIINHRKQINFPLNENIQKTIEYFFNNDIITYIDHFQEKRYSRCHIYSYPYQFKFYNNITNNFPCRLFTSVTKVSLYDERPFEHEFFLRIAQSFPFMKELKIKNQKSQNNKQLIKSNNDNQILSIIEYPYLNRLDLNKAHDDYIELFLFDTKMFLPNNLHLSLDWQSLKRVVQHYFSTRDMTQNNFVKLAALYIHPVDQIDEHIKYYFPHTCICETNDFVLYEYDI